MPARPTPLTIALDELARLGTGRDRERLTMLRDRLDGARLRVAVVGEATRGKSTLINALLGRPVLPAGETPLTTVVTAVRFGQDPHARVRYLDGHEERHSLAAPFLHRWRTGQLSRKAALRPGGGWAQTSIRGPVSCG